MTVKELCEKYKGYSIILWGENKYDKNIAECKKGATPFAYLHYTTEKELDEREVLEIQVDDTPDTSVDFVLTTSGLKCKGRTRYKGTVYAYVKKP